MVGELSVAVGSVIWTRSAICHPVLRKKHVRGDLGSIWMATLGFQFMETSDGAAASGRAMCQRKKPRVCDLSHRAERKMPEPVPDDSPAAVSCLNQQVDRVPGAFLAGLQTLPSRCTQAILSDGLLGSVASKRSLICVVSSGF